MLRVPALSPTALPPRIHFTDAQIVELTLRMAPAGFCNRVNDALQIDDGAAEAALPSPTVPPLEKEPHA